MLELCDPFGWHEVDHATILKIRERLHHFETMTWYEILDKGKKDIIWLALIRSAKKPEIDCG